MSDVDTKQILQHACRQYTHALAAATPKANFGCCLTDAVVLTAPLWVWVNGELPAQLMPDT